MLALKHLGMAKTLQSPLYLLIRSQNAGRIHKNVTFGHCHFFDRRVLIALESIGESVENWKVIGTYNRRLINIESAHYDFYEKV